MLAAVDVYGRYVCMLSLQLCIWKVCVHAELANLYMEGMDAS